MIIAAFCDGRTSTLTKNIDPGVYARLMTPAGERYGQAAVPGHAY